MSLKECDDRVAFFDYLRALAVTFVVVAHYRTPILPGGAIGVSVFFALSGYLICSLLLVEKNLTLSTCFRFSLKRFLRIFPPYVVSVALVGLMMFVRDPDQMQAYFNYLPGLLTFTYRPERWINLGLGVLWSLHVEFWFYVTFPLILLAVGVTKRLVAIFALLMIVSWTASYLTIRSGMSWAPVPSPLTALMWTDCLLMGAIVAVLHANGALKSIIPAARPLQVVCLSVLLAMALFMPAWVPVVWADHAASAVSAVLIAAYLASPIVVSLPVVGWIGRISFPIYLLHGVPAGYVEVPWLQSAKSIPVLILVIAASALMHYFVEIPSIRLGRKIAGSKFVKSNEITLEFVKSSTNSS